MFVLRLSVSVQMAKIYWGGEAEGGGEGGGLPRIRKKIKKLTCGELRMNSLLTQMTLSTNSIE